MKDRDESAIKIQFIEPNYHILLNKHPAIFDKKICEKILKVFRTNAIKGIFFLKEDEIFEFVNEEGLDQKGKQADHISQYNRTVKENLTILIKNEFIKVVPFLELKTNDLSEDTRYFFQQKEVDLSKEAEQHSKNAICDVVLRKMEDLFFPFSKILTEDRLFENLKEHIYHANYLLHQLIMEKYIIKVPFLQCNNGNEYFVEILLPGLAFKDKISFWVEDRFIPDLKSEFQKNQDNSLLKQIFEKHMFFIIESEITVGAYKKPIYQLCFMIIEAKGVEPDSISIETFNLANLILNIWLFLEPDPLLALQEYPNIEIGCDFLSPFFTQYIQEFSHIKDYLKMIKGFVDHHPAVIERSDLLEFFRSKGVQRKIVEEFLEKLPMDIQDIETKRKYYIISKGQIITAIELYHKDRSYRKVESARIEFEIVSQGFYMVEQSCFENEEQILKAMKTTKEKYKKAKGLITKNSDTYREHQKRKSEIVLPRIPHKKVYTNDDFSNFKSSMKELLIRHHKLLQIEARDKKGKMHTIYVRKNELNLKEAKMFIGTPDYNMIMQYFSE